MDDLLINIQDYVNIGESQSPLSIFDISINDSISLGESNTPIEGSPLIDFSVNVFDFINVGEVFSVLPDGEDLPDRIISVFDTIITTDTLSSDPSIYPKSLREKVRIIMSAQLGRMATDQEVDNGILDVDIRGLVSGFDINTSDLSITDYALGNTTTISSGAIAFQSGPTNNPTATINQDGSAVFTNVNITGRVLTIDNTQDIQTAINDLGIDGGTIHLRSGTYTVSNDIVLGSSTTLEGDSFANTFIDFGGGAYSVTATGTDLNTTGTVDAPIFDGGYGAFLVDANGTTTWQTDGIDNTYQIFLGTRWYKIAAVIAEDQLLLAEGYGDSLPDGIPVRIAHPIQDILMSNITIQNSSTKGVDFLDCRYFEMTDVYVTGHGGNGFNAENIMGLTTNRLSCILNGGYGASVKHSGFGSWNSIPCVGNGSGGFYLEDLKTIPISSSAADSNGGNGFTLVDCHDLYMIVEAAGNQSGGHGIEMYAGVNLVPGNDNVMVTGTILAGNAGDGIKLTDSNTDIKVFGNRISNNGGYGFNIVDTTSVKTIISNNDFGGNATDEYFDGGTDTEIRGNSGIEDVIIGAVGISSKAFTNFEATGRFWDQTNTGTGARAYGITGLHLSNAAGAIGSSRVKWYVGPCSGKSLFSSSIILNTNPPADTSSYYVGIGPLTVASAGITFTGTHIGFKIIGNTANGYRFYGSVATGGAETTTLLATVATGTSADLVLKVVGTSFVDFYYRDTSGASIGAWVKKTITSGIPALSGASFNDVQFACSTENTNAAYSLEVMNAGYER